MEICVQTLRGYDETIALARWCEQEGVPALSVADHYLAGRDLESEGFEQFVILGGVARETSTLALSTLVSPVTFRHPSVHLKAAVTLDRMSGGRFTLGLGTGWLEQEHHAFGIDFPPVGERFDRLEEALGYVTAAIDGSRSGFDGAYYRLAAFQPKPAPENLRLVVGGGGRVRTPTLAGRFAHEFNVSPDETPVAERIATCRAAATAAHRDPSTILISTAFPAALAADTESADAMLRRRAERMRANPDEAAASLDRLGIPRGTPHEAAPAFATLAEAGVARVYLQVSGASLEDIGRAVETARAAAALGAG